MFKRDEFLSKMHVEELDKLLFRGEALEMGLPRVFGGQVLGQALNAAVRTVKSDRKPHSLHGYFLRPGDLSRPIIFVEEGYSHQFDFPENVQHYSDLPNDYDRAEELGAKLNQSPEEFRSHNLIFDKDILDLRTPDLDINVTLGEYEPRNGFWFRFNEAIGDDPITHRTLLAFISDKALMATSLRPHPVSFRTHKIIGASLDHAMWFHEKIRVNEWIKTDGSFARQRKKALSA